VVRRPRPDPAPAVTWVPRRRPDAPRPTAIAADRAAAAAGLSGDTSSSRLPLLLAAALAVALLSVLAATVPLRVLPVPVRLRLYQRREALLTAGLAAAVSIAVGAVVALLGS
jgi:hypothetical protein